MELRAILHTTKWRLSLAFFFCFVFFYLPILLQRCAPPTPIPTPIPNRICEATLLHLLNHFKYSSRLFHPWRAPKLMASFGFGTQLALSPPPPALFFFFFLYFSFFCFFVKWARQKAKAIEAHLCWLSWIEGPLSWLFMRTALQKHIQITSSSPPSVAPCDTRMMMIMAGMGMSGGRRTGAWPLWFSASIIYVAAV